MNNKVDIIIRDTYENGERCVFSEFVEENGGKPYTDVSCSGSTYGMGCPCETEEKVQKAVESCKLLILDEGDKPLIKDLRDKATLKRFF